MVEKQLIELRRDGTGTWVRRRSSPSTVKSIFSSMWKPSLGHARPGEGRERAVRMEFRIWQLVPEIDNHDRCPILRALCEGLYAIHSGPHHEVIQLPQP